MTITPILIGGFGNRLYQLANAIRLTKIHNMDLKLFNISPQPSDVPKYRHLILRESDFHDFGGHSLVGKDDLPKTFNEIFPSIDYDPNPITIDNLLTGKHFSYDANGVNHSNDSILMGYFFPYTNIKNEIEDVRNLLNPNIEDYVKNNYLDLFTKKILGLHLRLGINTDNTNAVNIPNNFYNDILNIEKDNVDEIYVVTDNVDKSSHFIKQLNTFDKPIKIIEGEPMYVDMMILSFCSTLIMGPSTLSAWSAYLNKHNNVYTPSIWTRHHWTNDIPNTWKLY
jgi:hypothetical protein